MCVWGVLHIRVHKYTNKKINSMLNENNKLIDNHHQQRTTVQQQQQQLLLLPLKKVRTTSSSIGQQQQQQHGNRYKSTISSYNIICCFCRCCCCCYCMKKRHRTTITVALILCFIFVWTNLYYSHFYGDLIIPTTTFVSLDSFLNLPTTNTSIDHESFHQVWNVVSSVNTTDGHSDDNNKFTPTSHSQPQNSTILTLYLQEYITVSTPDQSTVPKKIVHRMEYPQMGISSSSSFCYNNNTSNNVLRIPKLPIDEFPDIDPYLPWIHDYHINYPTATEVRFIAQNKRRCYTGKGMESIMKHWEPQMALFQSISIREEEEEEEIIDNDRRKNTTKMRYKLSSHENATHKETRFLCRYHTGIRTDDIDNHHKEFIDVVTLSTYFFNYEYVVWRKRIPLPMYKLSGNDVSRFELSQLLFRCPIPHQVREILFQSQQSYGNYSPIIYLDVIPIRTAPRYTKLPMVTIDMVGPNLYQDIQSDNEWSNVIRAYTSDAIITNNNNIIPEPESVGRYANLPLCGRTNSNDIEMSNTNRVHGQDTIPTKQYHFVACTWTSASYKRRNNLIVIDDASSRLLEWIVFHQIAGIDHIYLYDNTQLQQQDDIQDGTNSSNNNNNDNRSLYTICQQFPDYVTYIPWPASVCNNNGPNHKNPGERSSQYAAEASCRSRFGDSTEWMTFIDTDEYLVPMMRQQPNTPSQDSHKNMPITTWHEVLHAMERKGYQILKMASSRGRPRIDLMEASDTCIVDASKNTSCLIPQQNETYLRIYNCDYIGHPRPHRFLRAMKQIYRPSFVLSHFVHYSAVTVETALYYNDSSKSDREFYTQAMPIESLHEHILDELSEGVLIHTKTVLPQETLTRRKFCFHAARGVCSVGYACDNSTRFDDATHTHNIFTDRNGKFCNCWIDSDVENYWVPLLEISLENYTK